ncbi:MAG: hypothetical protein CVV60_03255 [Tenericutes bacterium HGW-Tenericutes-5]|nr:MAG: hypothetical protein CVV60_03255 [Tenericutes bacterium HGW-Tenericutes-5]
MNYKVGSMWRKWDLHVHSPFSVLNNGDLGNGFDKVNQNKILDKYVYELFTKAINEKVEVIGITDYYLIEGYKSVKQILDDKIRLSRIFATEISKDSKFLEYIKKITLLPNIEFRLELGISKKTPLGLKNSKYQLHVIFSHEVEIQKIEDNFLHRLEYMTHVSDGKHDTYTITKENFESYGANLLSKGIGGNGSPLFVGMNNAYVDIKDVIKFLDSIEFKDKHIVILAEEDQSNQNWNDQLAGIRSNLYSASHAIFSSNEKTINWGVDGRSYKILKKNMPCIWGSDAHNFSAFFKTKHDRYTWIKADTTFDGLLLAIKNPINRIHIGESCKELEIARKRINYTFEKVKVDLKDKSRKSKVWFDIELTLNPFLVTIIGNKGSGKSALSDIIGYLGNSYNSSDYSFLSTDRFLSKRTKYGDYFNAELTLWNTDKVKKSSLSNVTDYTKSEMVKYLPQKYIEDTCNDLGESFQNEIDSAIFSYVGPQEKGTATTLADLISLKTKSSINALIDYRSQLEKTNNEIRRLEDKSTKIYRQDLENGYRNQQLKLKSHLENKPVEVIKPSDEFKHENSLIIDKISKRINEIDVEISRTIDQASKINNQIIRIEDFKAETKKLDDDINNINAMYLELSVLLELDKKDYVKFNFFSLDLDEKYESLVKNKLAISKLLNDTNFTLGLNKLPEGLNNEVELDKLLDESYSLYDKKDYLDLFIKRLLKDVSVDEQRYLEYQSNLKNWEQVAQMIEGNIPNTIDGESIKKYKMELDYLDKGIKSDLDSLKNRRLEFISHIYDEYNKIIDKYANIYSPIQEKIDYIMKTEIEKIEFKALFKVDESRLRDKILEYIDTRAGSDFKGKSEANKVVDDLIGSTDFNDKDSIITFVTELLSKICDNPNEIKKRLSNPIEFYNYITKLEYLNPVFSIVSGDRDLSELSPGERGIVLLIFYLALSKDNIPLVIDQPEDNLDNQSVYSRLVPAIIEAKKNRQVIVVTHNPNIAVACDSEQVIFCSINKDSGELIYESGSIENPIIKKHILDVLEGTKPAFDKRKTTYN